MKIRSLLPTRQEVVISTVLWVTLGFWLGLERVTAARVNFPNIAVWPIYRAAIAEHVILAVIAPLVLVAARLFPFEKRTFWKTLAVHCFGCAAYTALHVILGQMFQLQMPGVKQHSFLLGFTLELYYDVWMYALIVVIWGMLSLSRRYRQEEKRSAELQVRVAQAELQALRAQMQPHFLFNTLNSISSLMHHDVAAADDMIADLSFMLRRSLEQSGQAVVTLEDEVAVVKAYVRIQQRRFRDRLEASFSIPQDLHAARIPALLLQTFVENSIRHGISPHAKGGHIQVVARREGQGLRIDIMDDGGGFPENITEGVGISNSRARLRQLYGEEGALHFAPRFPRGACVTINLPLKTAETRGTNHETEDPDRGRRTAGTRASSVTVN